MASHDQAPVARNRKRIVLLAGLIVLIAFLYLSVGVFVVQPIGAVPDGASVIYLRLGTTMPFISSADGIILETGAGVSLLARGLVMAQVMEAIADRVLVRLPYSRTLYLVTTGGRELER